MPPLPLPASIRDPTDLIITLTQRLLDAIAHGDWDTYLELTVSNLTCFEPEAGTHLVRGLAFHRYYFDLHPSRARWNPNASLPPAPVTTTLVNPQVTVLSADGTSALITYVRLIQRVDAQGKPYTIETSESRVWVRDSKDWEKSYPLYLPPCRPHLIHPRSSLRLRPAGLRALFQNLYASGGSRVAHQLGPVVADQTKRALEISYDPISSRIAMRTIIISVLLAVATTIVISVAATSAPETTTPAVTPNQRAIRTPPPTASAAPQPSPPSSARANSKAPSSYG
ncbi:hypothetical protein HDU96_010209 [Phlyctochytrium bullatum]|nr:hypothetical protein HDU96_010209 [Phlyctochytrium bullatum]